MNGMALEVDMKGGEWIHYLVLLGRLYVCINAYVGDFTYKCLSPVNARNNDRAKTVLPTPTEL